MTPSGLAKLHALAFAPNRGWSAQEFEDLLANPRTTLITRTLGFALTRTLAGESELLVIAVAPHAQKQGIATDLMGEWLASLPNKADRAFLEVAEGNLPARALCSRFGFEIIAKRPGYYTRSDGPAETALVMSRAV